VTFTFQIPATGFSLGAATLVARPRTTIAGGRVATKAITLTAVSASPSPSPTTSPVAGAPRLDVFGDGVFAPGEAGSAVGVNLTPSESYGLDFAQSPGVILVRASTSSLGTVRFDFRIPTTARAGGATLSALPTDGTGLSASAAITISGAAVGPGGVKLPKTGRDIETYVGLGVILLLIGLALIGGVWQWRRRNRKPEHPILPAEHTRV
jgi:LPXTG-motif cell wall-anchored protein